MGGRSLGNGSWSNYLYKKGAKQSNDSHRFDIFTEPRSSTLTQKGHYDRAFGEAWCISIKAETIRKAYVQGVGNGEKPIQRWYWSRVCDDCSDDRQDWVEV